MTIQNKNYDRTIRVEPLREEYVTSISRIDQTRPYWILFLLEIWEVVVRIYQKNVEDPLIDVHSNLNPSSLSSLRDFASC